MLQHIKKHIYLNTTSIYYQSINNRYGVSTMLEKQTTLGRYGDSWIIRIPVDVAEDSQFPFNLQSIKDAKEDDKKTILVNIKIDKKRLIIENEV